VVRDHHFYLTVFILSFSLSAVQSADRHNPYSSPIHFITQLFLPVMTKKTWLSACMAAHCPKTPRLITRRGVYLIAACVLLLGLILPLAPLSAQGCTNPEAGFTATVDPNNNCQGTVGTVQHTITVLLNGQTVTYTCSQTLTLSCTTGRLVEETAHSLANRALLMK